MRDLKAVEERLKLETEHLAKLWMQHSRDTLRMTATKAIFEREGCAVHAIHIDTFLRSRFGCPDTHNKRAWTFIIAR